MMNPITMQHLKRLEAEQGHRYTPAPKHLKVFYGFSKLNKIQKREAIAVVFENEEGAGCETKRSYKTLNKLMHIVCERQQTPEEMRDAEMHNRVFTTYLIFLDDKKIGGSLDKALQTNNEADKNNVSLKMRTEIENKLRCFFKAHHPDYKEPTRQLELPFT